MEVSGQLHALAAFLLVKGRAHIPLNRRKGVPRGCNDALEKRKTSCPSRELNHNSKVYPAVEISLNHKTSFPLETETLAMEYTV
jgi:hypothetical protein